MCRGLGWGRAGLASWLAGRDGFRVHNVGCLVGPSSIKVVLLLVVVSVVVVVLKKVLLSVLTLETVLMLMINFQFVFINIAGFGGVIKRVLLILLTNHILLMILK